MEAHLENAAVRFGKRLFDLKSTDTRQDTVAGVVLLIFFSKYSILFFRESFDLIEKLANVIEKFKYCLPFWNLKIEKTVVNITSFGACPF